MQKITRNDRNIFRIAGWMWAIYSISLVIVDLFIYSAKPLFSPVLYYHLLTGLPVLLFLAFSYTTWTEKNPKIMVPVMILIITVSPIMANYLFNLHLPQAPLSNLEGMILRQLPVLLISLVLVAWHFRLWIMIVYSLIINLIEFGIVYSFDLLVREQMTSFSFIILIRTVSFLVVGMFINLLIECLRRQQETLIAANHQLIHYASTLENLTISRERNRMSRELHDTVVHTLSGLSVQLETVKAYWNVDSQTARNKLDDSLEVTRTGLYETRRAIKALRAAPLDDLGLIRALESLINDIAQRGHLTVTTHLPPEETPFAPDVEQCIYRIAQEALENVIHHAQANTLSIKLVISNRTIELMIQDDGIGFDPEFDLPVGHFGLAGMKERAQLAGGQLTISSRPNSGTTIRLFLKEGVG